MKIISYVVEDKKNTLIGGTIKVFINKNSISRIFAKRTHQIYLDIEVFSISKPLYNRNTLFFISVTAVFKKEDHMVFTEKRYRRCYEVKQKYFTNPI